MAALMHTARTRVEAAAWCLRIALAVSMLLGSMGLAHAQASLGAPRESAVKAAYLLNFAGFVEWPADALGGPGDAFVIAVLGDDAVAAELEVLAASRRVFDRPIMVRRGRDFEGGERVHIAYVAAMREQRVRDLAQRVGGPVLLVTHGDGLLAAGAVLNFVLQDGRLRFEASARNAEARGLRLSSRLLALAQYVDPAR